VQQQQEPLTGFHCHDLNPTAEMHANCLWQTHRIGLLVLLLLLVLRCQDAVGSRRQVRQLPGRRKAARRHQRRRARQPARQRVCTQDSIELKRVTRQHMRSRRSSRPRNDGSQPLDFDWVSDELRYQCWHGFVTTGLSRPCCRDHVVHAL
jgi:hypothetical protein